MKTHGELVVSNIKDSPHYHFIISGYSGDKNFQVIITKKYLLNQSKDISSKSLELKIASFIKLYDTYQKEDTEFKLIVQRNKSLFLENHLFCLMVFTD